MSSDETISTRPTSGETRSSGLVNAARLTSDRNDRPLEILLTEGSSTSARQTLYVLGRMGHSIDICDPQRLCLGRFSRYVRRWYRCPSFTAEPLAYLRFVNKRLRDGEYDVLFPVHDQVYLLARVRAILNKMVGVALPDFDALVQVQSKAKFSNLLDSLGLPQPPTRIVRTPAELDNIPWEFPYYVKRVFSTAGRGVWLVDSDTELRRLGKELADQGFSELVVQGQAEGTYCVVAAVFQRGRLLAAHCSRTLETGVGGSAQARESVLHPNVCEDVARLGAHLDWHGAMHVEYFYDDTTGQPTYIETNPRIGETFNAMLSGTNLCELLVQISLGHNGSVLPASRIGVKTHSMMTNLLAAGERGDGRRSLIREMVRGWLGKGAKRDSQDELTRPREDYLSLLPAMFVAARLIVSPAAADKMIRGAVSHYSLTDEAVHRFHGLPTQALEECFT